jgi:hypothetical protein
LARTSNPSASSTPQLLSQAYYSTQTEQKKIYAKFAAECCLIASKNTTRVYKQQRFGA